MQHHMCEVTRPYGRVGNGSMRIRGSRLTQADRVQDVGNRQPQRGMMLAWGTFHRWHLLVVGTA